jgi:hypothetical protein
MARPQPNDLQGFYDRDGYSIEQLDGTEVYSAGANALDSQQAGRSIADDTISRFCTQTGRALARERGVRWHGKQKRRLQR